MSSSTQRIVNDHANAPFLHLAVAGEAAVRVSGDRNVRALAGTRFAVLPLAAFLGTL